MPCSQHALHFRSGGLDGITLAGMDIPGQYNELGTPDLVNFTQTMAVKSPMLCAPAGVLTVFTQVVTARCCCAFSRMFLNGVRRNAVRIPAAFNRKPRMLGSKSV